MKRLLTSTTALSMALMPMQTLPSFAQVMAEDGRILAADGTVLCEPTADLACDIENPNIIEAARVIQEQMDIAAAAEAEAQATADAAAAAEAQAAADVAAAEAQAAADAAAAAEAQAAADAAAAAEAQAAADAVAAAEAQAATDAVAAAEAQAATDAAAEAEAQAAAEAAAEAEAQAAADAAAEADAQAAADAAAAAEAQAAADAATAAEAQAAVDAAAAAEAQAAADAAAAEAQAAADAAAIAAAEAQAAADAASDADAQAAQDAALAAQAAADAAAVDAQAAADAAVAAETQAAADAAAAAEAQAAVDADAAAAAALATAAAEAEAAAADAAAQTPEAAPEQTPAEVQEQTDAALAEAEAEITAPDGTFIDPSAGLAVMETVIDPDAPLVDAPVISEAETVALTTLLAAPVDPSLDAPAPEVAAPIDAPLPALTEGAAADPAAAAVALTELPLTEGAVAATVATIAPEEARTSAQEFSAAPQTTASGKKTGLSDLEKVGLFVLGAVIVGQILDATVGQNNRSQQVVSNTGDRVVVLNPDGTYGLYKDDDAILRQAGSTVRTETYQDGSSRTIVQRVDGTQVVTVRDATGRVLRRAQYDRLGRELVLLDDFAPEVAVNVSTLPAPRVTVSTRSDDAALRAALAAREIAKLKRSFSLRQIREIAEVRALAAEVDVERVTFPSGSAAISTEQANALADLGAVMQDLLDKNPAEMFLIEGHTDATGAAAMNLALSDRRAESVALALTEYFGIPPENMIVQGYGESELRINTQANEPLNRRVAVRIITPLLTKPTQADN